MAQFLFSLSSLPVFVSVLTTVWARLTYLYHEKTLTSYQLPANFFTVHDPGFTVATVNHVTHTWSYYSGKVTLSPA